MRCIAAPEAAPFMNRWHEVWRERTATAAAATLTDLIRLDGFDVGIGKVDEQAWNDYVAELVRRLGMAAGDSVFEVGCGGGALLFVLYQAGHPVGGIDYSPALIEHARRTMPGMPFAVAEASSYTGDARDFVVTNSVFSYFPDHDYAQVVFARMLAMARKGVAILDVPDLERRDAAEAARRAALPPGEYEARYRGLEHRYYSREWFAALAARYGWQIDVAEQWLAGYGNAPYRFNVMLTPQSR
jgi:trans-aconitate methyltransferase